MKQQIAIADEGAEAALILSILKDNSGMRAVETLEPTDFSNGTLGAIFADMRTLQESGRQIDVVSMRFSLDGIRDEDGKTAREFLNSASVATIEPDPAALSRHVAGLSTRRKLSALGRKMIGVAKDEAADVKASVAAAREQLAEVYADAADKTAPVWYGSHAERLIMMLQSNEPTRTPTGIAAIDEARGGFGLGEYVVMGARPSMGKSAVMSAMAINAARSGRGVVVISIEMSGEAFVARTLSMMLATENDTRIEYESILNKRISEEEYLKVYKKAEDYRRLPIRVHAGNSGLADIAAHVSEAKREFAKEGIQLGLVIVDHIGIVTKSNRYSGNLVNEIGQISKSLAALGREQNVTMVALSQLSRKVEERQDKWPVMSDLRDSGNLEEDADVIMLLFRPAYYLERDLDAARVEARKNDPRLDDETVDMQKTTHPLVQQLQATANVLAINMAKNRNGVIATLKCFIDPATNVVR